MASRSERLAELRAALLELDACVAKYRGVRVPRAPAPAPGDAVLSGAGGPAEVGAGRASEARAGSAVGVGGRGAEARPGIAKRLRPRLLAVVAWWRRSRAKQQPMTGRAPPG